MSHWIFEYIQRILFLRNSSAELTVSTKNQAIKEQGRHFLCARLTPFSVKGRNSENTAARY